MNDVVNCSYCGGPVTWGRYADHVRLFHKWDAPYANISMPHVLETEVIVDSLDDLNELQGENDRLLDQSITLNDTIKELELRLAEYEGK